MFFNNILASLKKILSSKGFYLCVLFSLLLFFCAEVYCDPDVNSRYSVIRALLNIGRDKMRQDSQLWSISVMKSARGGWVTFFAPIITAFVFAPMISDETAAKARSFQLFRSSSLKFSLSEFLSGTVCAGLAMALGYLLFCLCVYFLFPSPENITEWEEQLLGGFSPLSAALSVWLYGSFWSMPAMVLTSVLSNKYLIMCLPFFLKYVLNQSYQLLFQTACGDYVNVNERLLGFINVIYPDALLYLWDDPQRLLVLLVFGCAALALLTAFLLIFGSKKRRGTLI
ncbi:MAG: hypothetical protein NC203_08175 [Firmicutes bacterium]|nr:hypothetical protein [Bacillota bacterium]